MIVFKTTIKSFPLWIGIQYMVITLPAEIITVSLTKLLLQETFAETYMVVYFSSEFTMITRLLGNIIYMVLIVFLLIGKELLGHNNHGWKNYILFLSIPVYQTLLVAGLFSVCSAYLTVPITVAGHMIAVFSILIDFAVIIVIENMNERIDREEELSGLETMRKQELAYLEWDVQQTEAVRLVRHDLGNQLQTLSAMMEDNGDRNRVRVMLEEIMQRVNRVNPGAEDNGNV